MLPRQPLLRSFHLQRIRNPHLTSPLQSPTSTSTSAQTSPLPQTSRRPAGLYTISRTSNGELPVYSEVRNGGGWKTIIRKVDGDVHTLRDNLNEYFKAMNVDPLKQSPTVTMKPTNRNLVVKGRWVDEVKGYLEEKGL
ncbi:large subunit ribosomal protein L49, partial [Tremellales sp. Uapishka_1]